LPDDAAVRSFRFACRATGGQARTAKEWCELALRAEDLGYDTFGVSDHFATAFAPLVLQLVATCTSRPRLAMLVLNNDFRHPAVLAKEAATLDLLSGGRLELGMGAGWQPPDYEQSEHPVRPGPGPRRALRESLQVLKRLFGDAPATMAGRHWAVRGLSGVPAPMQRPHPPLMVGGTGPRLLRMAAEEADIVGFDSGPATMALSTWSLSALAEKARLVREAAQSSDVELHLNPEVWAVGANRR